jgi:MFS family permease
LAAGFATIWWSIFTAANAVAGGLTSLVIFRLGLGIGEAVGPPAFGKVVGRWFPLRERALAAAVYDSGSRLGTALALPIVTVIIAVFFAGSGPTAFVVPLVATGGVVVLGALSYLVICGRFEPLPSAAVAPRRGVRERL